jgi:hypothetical protein
MEYFKLRDGNKFEMNPLRKERISEIKELS